MGKSHNDYITDILEEIALEGLEGITIEALWTRLTVRPHFILRPENDDIKSFLWRSIVLLAQVEFYMLPEPRKPLILFNRTDYIDSSGNFVEPEDVSVYNIYGHKPVQKDGVMGSCCDYDDRVNISSEVRFKQLDEAVAIWGDSLVIVANQDIRRLFLTNPEYNPLNEIPLMQYCILERIGRSRYCGELTQGKMGLQVILDDPKLCFYYRKYLNKNKLIAKQTFYLRVGKVNVAGSLLHLPRYYTSVKQKYETDIEKLVDYIKVQPGQYILYKHVHEILGPNSDAKKLLQKYKHVKAESVPYRYVYPNAKQSEWKMKASTNEKQLRIIRLSQNSASEDDDEDEDEDEQKSFLDLSERKLDIALIRQCYIFIENAGPQGLTQGKIGLLAGVPSLHARAVCKFMVRNEICGLAFVDAGRQRVSHFYSKKYDSCENAVVNELKEAKSKLIQMISEKSNINTPDRRPVTCNKRPQIDSSIDTPAKKLKVDESTENFFKNVPKDSSRPPPSQEELDAIETEIKVSESPSPSEKIFPNFSRVTANDSNPANLTLTILRRANLILQAINTHKVIHDPQKLQRMINEEEESEGAKHVIDRKTVQRLIEKLKTSGHLKTIKVRIKGFGKERNMTFICHPSISEDNSEIQSAIEQAKMKLPIITKEHVKRKRLNSSGLSTFSDNLKQTFFTYDKGAGKKYGFKPKFVRMQVLHVYMYYLIYGYKGDVNLNQEECKNNIIKSLNLDKSIVNEMSTVYSTAINWKMFIPPLPPYEEYGDGEGWSLMSDLLLRLPLSIFVSIINVPYVIPNLCEYLNHPIRKYFLVKNLPSDISNHLTYNRKYIFSVSEIINRLAYIGLVQLGPQKLKEKDQIFVYLNKHAVLLDTTTSDAGYNHVSKDIEYEQMHYHFKDKDAIEQYWHDLWNCAMNTNLGCRNSMTGHSVVIESINTKKILQPCLQSKSFEEAIQADTGYLPGDNLGAGGLDSDLFSHLRRSWYWPSDDKNENNGEKNIIRMPSLKQTANRSFGKKRTISQLTQQIPSEEVIKPKKIKNGNDLKTKKENLIQTNEKNEINNKKQKAKKHKKITRVVKPKKMRFCRKPYYDQKDKEALKRMVKLRVDWSPTEDNLLLICKVASLYMSPNPKRQVAKNFSVIREILHSTYPNLSRNKTSRACQRRILYMMKNPSTSHSVYMCLEEIKQDPDISDKFNRAVEKLDAMLKAQGEGPKGYQKEYDKIFNSLVLTLLSKLKTITNAENATLDNVSIPDSLEEFKNKYAVVFPKNVRLQNGTFNEVQNSVDILCSVVNTILHSSLCCATDKVSYSYQLFYVYQQYPDKLLRSVLAKCRSMQIISCRKKFKRWKSTNEYLPLSTSPYQLSITYVNILQTRFQYVIFSESFYGLKCILEEVNQQSKIKKLESNTTVSLNENNCNLADNEAENWEGSTVLNINNGGECANIVELYSAGCIKLDIQFPDQLIVLDPRVTKTEESYKLIVKRFRELLSMIKGSGSKKDKKSLLSEDDYEDEDDEDMNASKSKTVAEDESTSEDDIILNNKCGIANPATRLALYLMRDEPFEYTDQSLQHAHDLFVLKPCKITAHLNRKKIKSILEIDSIRNDILSGIRRLASFPETPSENEAIIELLESDCDKYLLLQLLNYLEAKKELGATYKDIEDNVGRSNEIEKILQLLVQKQFILKSGSVNVRFIHSKFTKPWLIRTYYIPRYKKEELGNTNTNTSYALSIESREHRSVNSDRDQNHLKVTGEIEGTNINNEKTDASKSEEGNSKSDFNLAETSGQTRLVVKPKKRKWVAVSKENLNRFGEINFSSLPLIHISVRPWFRVDGTLNRRVLDRLLGTILGHCLSVPGITIKNLQKRFTPALQPVHTLELVDILEKIGCIRKMVIKKSLKPNLFSKRINIETGNASGFDDVNDVYVEPELVAISKLGQFIGNPAYGKDYLDALTEAKISYS
ncbi:hypothetical protein O3M35_001209 [Rhynocoris fuscipes]|uniref:General transcription factor 3C polypeptide 1 n=1 Tax=Rhynocoris fuscipes TaxID=488301 RepID=A0AAW1DRB8_9HEMI